MFRIFLKDKKFPQTKKSPQGSFETSNNVLSPDKTWATGNMLYKFGQHDNGSCLEILHFNHFPLAKITTLIFKTKIQIIKEVTKS